MTVVLHTESSKYSNGRTQVRPYAGVELGGTKCVCTLASGPEEIIDQRIVSTARPVTTLPAIVDVLTEWESEHGFGALGVASFGPLDLNPRSDTYGRILDTNKTGWRGVDVLGILSSPFGVPAGFDTDVNGAALAEGRWGGAIGLDDFAYVTVGTGVGVGLIVHGRPTRGIGHSEIGHLRVPRLPRDEQLSVCRFHTDCVEGLASGTAIQLRIGNRTIDEVPVHDSLWEPIVDALAIMCHAMVCTTGPQRIVIGGGVVSGQPHLLERIEARLIQSLSGYMTVPGDRPYVVAPALGDMAGPLGPIALAIEVSTPREMPAGGDLVNG